MVRVLSRYSILLKNELWKLKANCRGKPIELFFPIRKVKVKPFNGKGKYRRYPDELVRPKQKNIPLEAKILCSECDVRIECASYAIEENLIGIWGGFNTEMLKRINNYRTRHKIASEEAVKIFIEKEIAEAELLLTYSKISLVRSTPHSAQ